MTFLYATLLCMFVSLADLWAHVTDVARSGDRIKMAGLQSGFLGAMFLAAMLTGVVVPNTVSLSATNYTPILFGIASAFGIAKYGGMSFLVLHVAQTNWRSKLWQGACILATCSSFYICYTTLDHARFWRDADRTGIASDLMFRNTDVKCDASVILIKREGRGFVYRCPHSLVLGHVMLQPFVPWPSYDEGFSVDLAARHDRLMEEARGAGDKMPRK